MVAGILVALVASGSLLCGRTLVEHIPLWALMTLIIGGDTLALGLALVGVRKASEDQWLTVPKLHIAALVVVFMLQPIALMVLQSTPPPQEPPAVVNPLSEEDIEAIAARIREELKRRNQLDASP